MHFDSGNTAFQKLLGNVTHWHPLDTFVAVDVLNDSDITVSTIHGPYFAGNLPLMHQYHLRLPTNLSKAGVQGLASVSLAAGVPVQGYSPADEYSLGKRKYHTPYTQSQTAPSTSSRLHACQRNRILVAEKAGAAANHPNANWPESPRLSNAASES